MRWTVTMKLKPVRIDEKPATKTPTTASVTFVFDADRRCRACRTSSRCRCRRWPATASVIDAADDVDVPAQQVDAREREVLRADHDRHQEVAERRRNRRDQEEEDHHDAVHREELVVQCRRDHESPCGVSSSSGCRRRTSRPIAKKIVIEIRYRIAMRLWSLREQPRLQPVRRVEIAVTFGLVPAMSFITMTLATCHGPRSLRRLQAS